MRFLWAREFLTYGGIMKKFCLALFSIFDKKQPAAWIAKDDAANLKTVVGGCNLKRVLRCLEKAAYYLPPLLRERNISQSPARRSGRQRSCPMVSQPPKR